MNGIVKIRSHVPARFLLAFFRMYFRKSCRGGVYIRGSRGTRLPSLPRALAYLQGSLRYAPYKIRDNHKSFRVFRHVSACSHIYVYGQRVTAESSMEKKREKKKVSLLLSLFIYKIFFSRARARASIFDPDDRRLYGGKKKMENKSPRTYTGRGPSRAV